VSVYHQRPRPDPPIRRRPSRVRPGWRVQAQQFVQTGRIVSAVLVAVVLFLAIRMTWSEQYLVRNVTVTGAKILNEQRISQMIPMHGMSIWAVDPNRVAETIQASPYVDAVSVNVTLPDTVIVAVTEHQSDIRWKVGDWYLMVDTQGTVMGTDTEVVLTDTLVINDDSGASTADAVRIDVGAIRTVQALALRLPVEAKLTVTRYGWDPRRGVTLNTTDGRLILLGDETRLEEKLQLLRELSDRQVEYVFADLRPLTPYYRYDIPPQALLATTTVVTDTLSVPENQP
jgi:cell division septal protein FtsQ